MEEHAKEKAEETITLKLSNGRINNLITFLNRATLQGSEVSMFTDLMQTIQMQVQAQQMMPPPPVTGKIEETEKPKEEERE